MDGKRRKEGVNLVIPFVPSADNSNLSADGDDSFISVDSAMPSPFSEVRLLLNVFITAVGCILTSQQGHDAKPLVLFTSSLVGEDCIRTDWFSEPKAGVRREKYMHVP